MTFAPLLASVHAMASGQTIATADQAADRAAKVTQSHHLSSNRTQCLMFDVSDEKRYFVVGVHEKHPPECGGDPATDRSQHPSHVSEMVEEFLAPHLFGR
ncbi:hypothetical protein [Paraburkholderia sp. UCT2]|uniref:hypothetical protein n=1 Tax=Paraburkholderia sp. UCT2 TaxID=2615208 RepID=UPI0016560582|nr:hypothetical protein [Paraburkholderia sp. UCT2]MBC8733153.1 hypothetical protein [Paraburkholderia sp. UCT2]